jgi:hypothetical protein
MPERLSFPSPLSSHPNKKCATTSSGHSRVRAFSKGVNPTIMPVTLGDRLAIRSDRLMGTTLKVEIKIEIRASAIIFSRPYIDAFSAPR